MSKKFKDTTVGQLLFGAASVINPTLGNVLQGVTSPKEAIAAISKSDVATDDKIKLQEIIYEQQNKEIEAITSRWEADSMSDSWLSKNTRPLTLIYLTFASTILMIIDSFHTTFDVDEAWVGLLKTLLITVYVAYFGSRGAEKITKINK